MNVFIKAMVSNKLKCIFIEVPKTASTSIRQVLGFPRKPHLDIMEVKNEMENDWPFNIENYGKLHFVNRVIPNHVKINAVDKIFNIYFKFGFVRNPWDRVVSLYFRKEGIKMSDRMTFEEFVKWIRNSSDTSIHASVHKNQLDWFTDEYGKVAVDFIGKFENLEEDSEFVFKKLGVNKKLPHVNKSKAPKMHYTEYYTPKTRDIIAHKFSVDIEYFGYEYGK